MITNSMITICCIDQICAADGATLHDAVRQESEQLFPLKGVPPFHFPVDGI